MANFIPLHIKSGYSFLSSGLTIEKISESLTKNKFMGAGLTDRNVLYGAPSFIHALEEKKQKWILGIEVVYQNIPLSLFCTDEESYRTLCNLTLKLGKEDFNFQEYLLDNKTVNLIGVLSTNNDEFKALFKSDHFAKDLLNINKLVKTFYLGIEILSVADNQFAKQLRAFAKEHTYQCVAFPEVLYQKKEDAIVLDIVTAIKNDEVINNKESNGNQYFMPSADYARIYNINEINATEEILNSNHLNFLVKRGELLHYPIADSKAYLRELVMNGLQAKITNNKNVYLERIEYELSVINEMGYADYFLIVQDYVKHAKEIGILVGPGRGSAAGSLVSYLLGITEIDPLLYGLQFERFLNKARKTMPDIDIDFMDTRRDEMVTYMHEKYGQDRVANIVTFQTIMAKQSLRDVGRVYNYPSRHIDLLSKTITNPKLTLKEAYKQLPAFRNLVDSDKYFLEIVSLAYKIEGLPRQSGLHAAGIILNNEPLSASLPTNADFNDNLISEYEMDYLEEQGFLKMDFLSLRNLTTIQYAVDLINKNHPEVNLKADEISYRDPKIFSFISTGMTTGLFQIESAGMRAAIKKIKPQCFEDIVLLLSIFRPGPMDNINDYVARKSGKKPVYYLNEDMKAILGETQGVLVYQEQVNSIAQKMAGFTLSEADVFRRAISKKKFDVLEKQQTAFINGMIKKGFSKKDADILFNDILKFANYGFNKSHAVAYSIIACRMAYLKYYYPLEFYAAILQIASGVHDTKFNEYISEMKKRDFNILLPNINRSTTVFEIAEKGLIFPLSSIHGINAVMVNKIIAERNANGAFTDFFDFVVRLYPERIKHDQIEALVNAGAFDCFNLSRTTLNGAILGALQYAELCFNDSGQMTLSSTLMPKPLIYEEPDDPQEKLYKEYEALGVMLGDNPLHFKKDLIAAAQATDLAEINNTLDELLELDNPKIPLVIYDKTIAVIIRSIKTINTKKTNTTMAFLKVYDESFETEVVLFPKVFATAVTYLAVNKIVVVTGRYEQKEEKRCFIAETIRLLEEE